jgi:hypothetical protein
LVSGVSRQLSAVLQQQINFSFTRADQRRPI